MEEGKGTFWKGRLRKGLGEVTGRDDLKRQGDVEKASGRLKQGLTRLEKGVKSILRREPVAPRDPGTTGTPKT